DERRPQVDVHDPVPFVNGHVEEVAARVDTRVVDQDVGGTPCAGDEPHQLLDRSRLPELGRVLEHRVAGQIELGEEPIEYVGARIGQTEARAGPREGCGD